MNPLAALFPPGTGTDPNSGEVLRDEFHQIRGDNFNRVGSQTAGNLARDFLASRGAPMTPQNLVIAREYLQGGALGALDQQRAVEDEIASQAIAAVAGASAGGAAVDPISPSSAPSARPPASTAPAIDQIAPDDGSGMGGLPFLLPGMLVGEAARRAATGTDVAPVGPRVQPPQAIEGEVVNDVAVRPRQPGAGAVRSAADDAIEDAIVTGVNPAATANALPPPQAAAPQPNPYAAQTQAALPAPPQQLPAPPIESAPVPTEDVVPESKPAARPRQGTSMVGPNGEKITESTAGGYRATAKNGKTVTGATPAAVRKALRGL